MGNYITFENDALHRKHVPIEGRERDEEPTAGRPSELTKGLEKLAITIGWVVLFWIFFVSCFAGAIVLVNILSSFLHSSKFKLIDA